MISVCCKVYTLQEHRFPFWITLNADYWLLYCQIFIGLMVCVFDLITLWQHCIAFLFHCIEMNFSDSWKVSLPWWCVYRRFTTGLKERSGTSGHFCARCTPFCGMARTSGGNQACISWWLLIKWRKSTARLFSLFIQTRCLLFNYVNLSVYLTVSNFT